MICEISQRLRLKFHEELIWKITNPIFLKYDQMFKSPMIQQRVTSHKIIKIFNATTFLSPANYVIALKRSKNTFACHWLNVLIHVELALSLLLIQLKANVVVKDMEA